MKVAYNWLKQYIDIDIPSREVSEILTNTGLEIAGVYEYEPVKGGLKGLVAGKVLTCTKHPNADRLSLTTVDIGRDKPLSIVCGAPNVAKNQKVVVAPVGTDLYSGDQKFTIKKTKIRGELSEGMICAEDEIGLSDRHDGIIVLDEKVIPGSPVSSYFDIENDTVFEIDLTPNRIDGASHYGVARDLAAFLSMNKKIKPVIPDVSSFRIEKNDYPVKVSVQNPGSCNRYAGVSVTGITIKPSPGWLQKRLRSIGLTPINNVVDITNFVLFELGQPLHAFDGDKLSGRKIIVKNLPEGTRFVTLDGAEHILSQDDLMICDESRPVAMAGVFGGLDSGITEETQNVFLESAYFNPVSIRKTAKRHGISTDSSFRFERGVDPAMILTALKRAALLIKELAGGTIASEIVDEYPRPVNNHEVRINLENVDNLVGIQIERQMIKCILESLDIQIVREEKHFLDLIVPAYRVDVTREADVIEEILRIYGYNSVPVPGKLNASVAYTKMPDKESITNTVSDYLSNNGFYEIMSNSLTRRDYYTDLKSFDSDKLVGILNPISNDLGVMRQTLLFGGLEAIVYNTNRKNPDLRLYEFGNCYFADPKKQSDDPVNNYKEDHHLALFLTGRRQEVNWTTSAESSGFFQMKAYIENILTRLGFLSGQITTGILRGKEDIFSRGLVYYYKSEIMIEAGFVHPSILKSFEIDNDVFYADIYWDTLIKGLKDHEILFRELPRYPEVKRDLALLLDREVKYDEIKKLAFETEKKLLKRINLFDVYQGDKIPEGKKSYAISFILQDESKTLSDKDIDRIMKKLMSVYTTKLKAEIR